MSNRAKANICFIASLITLVGIPLVVTVIKYKVIQNLHQQPLGTKISIIAALIILVLCLVFCRRLIKFLKVFKKYTIYNHILVFNILFLY